jgi:hypothetical protein
MGRGIVVGLLIGIGIFAGFLAYERVTTDSGGGKGVVSRVIEGPNAPMTVAELEEEATPEQLDAVRTNPDGLMIQVKDQNYPMLLAFLDLDVDLTDRAVEQYREVFENVDSFYANNTPRHVTETVRSIKAADQYFPGLSHLNCLEYLNDTVPDAFAEGTEEANSGGEFDSVRTAGQAIYDWLVAYHDAPQKEAEAEMAEYQREMYDQMERNKQAMRDRGAARTAAKAQMRASEANIMRQEAASKPVKYTNWGWGGRRWGYGSRRGYSSYRVF